jgi:UDP-GlcNAc:undecaprenyl-phosphate/decaprenyl-phosphate GlcNAc-1-phosphate transferase
MLFLTTLLISIIVTIAIMPYSRELAIKLKAMDMPDERKIHGHVMPKCGGIAMSFGAFFPILLWAPKNQFVNGLLIGAVIIVVFGLLDDINNLKPHIKLVGQILAALVITIVGGIKINDLGAFWTSGAVLPDWASIPLTVFVVVGVTNATNLADGLDGLAGGITLLIFLCIGYLGVIQKDWVLVMIAIATGGSVLGFLRFNTYPAQLFMGDAGSQLLGFVGIVLAIKLAQQAANISVILPLIIFGIPILDTLTVMIRRLSRGRSPFSADRNHFHHQLMTIGLFHTEAVLTIYLAQALLILFAIGYHGTSDWLLLTVYLLSAGIVLGSFRILHKNKFWMKRGNFLSGIKAHLKRLRDQGQIIKVAFGIVKVGFPALLIFNARFQPNGSRTDLILAGSFLILMILAWFLNNTPMKLAFKIVFYLLTPFLIYKCDLTLYTNWNNALIILYNALYVVLLASVLLTMSLTRRAQGFKSSPMDFLVVIAILLISNVPDAPLKGHYLGLVAGKTVILYYSYEVLVGEFKRGTVRLKVSVAAFFIGIIGLVSLGASFLAG